MRASAYDRIKRGVLLASMGAAFLLPASAAQASSPAHGPARGWLKRLVPVTQQGGGPSGPGFLGHKVG